MPKSLEQHLIEIHQYGYTLIPYNRDAIIFAEEASLGMNCLLMVHYHEEYAFLVNEDAHPTLVYNGKLASDVQQLGMGIPPDKLHDEEFSIQFYLGYQLASLDMDKLGEFTNTEVFIEWQDPDKDYYRVVIYENGEYADSYHCGDRAEVDKDIKGDLVSYSMYSDRLVITDKTLDKVTHIKG